MNNALLSSNSNEWETPQKLFDRLNSEFHFTLDAASTDENAKCPKHYTKKDEALLQDWPGVVWCNPPYGKAISKFVQKGYEEAQKGATVVMLIPARTDTKYWHRYVMKAKQIRFIEGRLRFNQNGKTGSAPFPSAILIFAQGNHTPSIVSEKAL